jgi:hypothetical protein
MTTSNDETYSVSGDILQRTEEGGMRRVRPIPSAADFIPQYQEEQRKKLEANKHKVKHNGRYEGIPFLTSNVIRDLMKLDNLFREIKEAEAADPELAAIGEEKRPQIIDELMRNYNVVELRAMVEDVLLWWRHQK